MKTSPEVAPVAAGTGLRVSWFGVGTAQFFSWMRSLGTDWAWPGEAIANIAKIDNHFFNFGTPVG
jgi:hypothetical protein